MKAIAELDGHPNVGIPAYADPNDHLRIGIIVGSTRPGRNADSVAKWVHEVAKKRGDVRYEIVDIKDFNLPLLDEPLPAGMGQYSRPHTKAWAAKIDSYDAFVFVTPEYNHGIPGALKNAIDFIYREWNDKAAGLVTYGGDGGTSAGEQLRSILDALQIAAVNAQVKLSLYSDFENFTTFKPMERRAASVNAMLDQVVAWGSALKQVRMKKTVSVN